MSAELLQALAIILETCYAQDNCSTCPMKEFCSKMPCDW